MAIEINLTNVQEQLISGTNIKTINSESLLGSGNIVISSGGAVDSVNGLTGVVVLDTDEISEGTNNLYFTDSRVSNNADVTANTAKNSYPSADALKLADIEFGAQVNTVFNVNGLTGNVTVQDTLVSGTNIKTINNQSLLGSGNITISGTGAVDSVNGETGDVTVQETLVSGTNIKTINGSTLLGSGNITVGQINSVNGQYGPDVVLNASNISETATRLYMTPEERANLANQSGTNTGDQDLSGLQDTLVSGTNIKTINSQSLLGSGDIVISGGAVDSVNSLTGVVVLDTDDISEGTTNLYYPSGDKQKVDFITITRAINLNNAAIMDLNNFGYTPAAGDAMMYNGSQNIVGDQYVRFEGGGIQIGRIGAGAQAGYRLISRTNPGPIIYDVRIDEVVGTSIEDIEHTYTGGGSLRLINDAASGIIELNANSLMSEDYGVGNKSASDLGKTESDYLLGLATDGTFIEVDKTVIPIGIACSDETTALTTGTAKATFRMPYAFELTEVRANVTTAPTGSVLTVDINESGTTILSTKLTIDAGEETSTTAAIPVVISDSSLADDAKITIDIDTVGSTVAGAGLKIWLIGSKV